MRELGAGPEGAVRGLGAPRAGKRREEGAVRGERPTVAARARSGAQTGRDSPRPSSPPLGRTLTKSSMTGSLSPSFSPLTGTDSAIALVAAVAPCTALPRLARRCHSRDGSAAPLPSPALRATERPRPAARSPPGPRGWAGQRRGAWPHREGTMMRGVVSVKGQF